MGEITCNCVRACACNKAILLWKVILCIQYAAMPGYGDVDVQHVAIVANGHEEIWTKGNRCIVCTAGSFYLKLYRPAFFFRTIK